MTALSTWLRESPSLWAFPFVLILHTVGLAFLVGANVALDARVLGLAADVPPTTLRRPRRRARNAGIGVAAGVAAFATIWGALSRPAATAGVATEHIDRTPDAHGGDVVTVILADFRGLDTMVEITVLAVAVVGVASLLSRGRAW